MTDRVGEPPNASAFRAAPGQDGPLTPSEPFCTPCFVAAPRTPRVCDPSCFFARCSPAISVATHSREPTIDAGAAVRAPCKPSRHALLPTDATTSLISSWEAVQPAWGVPMLHVQQQQPQHHHQQAHAPQRHHRQSQQHEAEHDHEHHHGVMKASGCKKGGRPVTWIGGGGMDPKRLAGMGVPMLRSLFSQVFGQPTASNNAAWLRRKLSETPDSVHGQRRSPVVRARDSGAAIWNQDEGGPWLLDEGGLADGHMLLDSDAAATAAAPEPAVLMAGGGGMVPVLQPGPAAGPHHHPGAASPSPVLSGPSSGAWASSGKRDRLGAVLAASHTLAAAFSSRQPRAAAAAAPPATAAQGAKQAEEEGACCYASGVPIRPDALDGSYTGRRVLVYWPADCQWWEATVSLLDVSGKRVQLLYADLTEECIAGRDFDELLRNEHLLLALTGTQHASGSGSPGSGASSNASQQLLLQSGRPLSHAPSAPAALLAMASDGCTAAAAAGANGSLLADITSNSSGRSTGFVRSLSASLATAAGTSSSDREDAAAGPAPSKRPRTLAAEQQQQRVSPGSSAGDAAINSFAGMGAEAGARAGFAAAEQQQQWMAAADAACLGATFANQQLQQLHLQQQAQMQMQFAADHYLLQQQQQQLTALVPSNAAAAAAAAVAMQAALNGSPTAAMAAAAAAGKCAMLVCSAQMEHEARARQMQAETHTHLAQQQMQPSLLPAQQMAGTPPGSKTVRIKLQPEYLDGAAAQPAAAAAPQPRPRTPALPSVSGATATTTGGNGAPGGGQALSGFTGGAFRHEAFDELDTLLSAPSQAPFSSCWDDDESMQPSGGGSERAAALLPPCSGAQSPHHHNHAAEAAAGCCMRALCASGPACSNGGHSCGDEEASSGPEASREGSLAGDGCSGAVVSQRGCQPMLLEDAAGANFLDAVAGALGCCTAAAAAGGGDEEEGGGATLAHVFDYGDA